jgi:preprotein translocase subunit SecY
MAEMLRQHGGGILGMFRHVHRRALGRMTVFALNIMPYISRASSSSSWPRPSRRWRR